MKTYLKYLLVTILGIFFFVVGTRYYAEHVKLGELVSTRHGAETASENLLAEQVNSLKKAGVIDEEIAFSKADQCSVGSLDAGWTVRSWQQTCSLWYVRGFTTKLDQSSVLKLLGSQPTTAGKFGELLPPYGCLLSKGFSTPTSDAMPNVMLGTTLKFRPQGSKEKNYDCGVPDQYEGYGEEYMAALKNPPLKIFSAFNPDSIGSSENQIWIIQEHRYYYDELGCGFGLFCPSPRSVPLMAP